MGKQVEVEVEAEVQEEEEAITRIGVKESQEITVQTVVVDSTNSGREKIE